MNLCIEDNEVLDKTNDFLYPTDYFLKIYLMKKKLITNTCSFNYEK